MAFRVKDLINESRMISEAQIRDASPQFQQFAESAPNAVQAIGSALGEISGIQSMGEAARDAISGAMMAAGDPTANATIDNINSVQDAQSDPSAIITLKDHQSGIQQACNLLNSIMGNLNAAMASANKLGMLASRQFL